MSVGTFSSGEPKLLSVAINLTMCLGMFFIVHSAWPGFLPDFRTGLYFLNKSPSASSAGASAGGVVIFVAMVVSLVAVVSVEVVVSAAVAVSIDETSISLDLRFLVLRGGCSFGMPKAFRDSSSSLIWLSR